MNMQAQTINLDFLSEFTKSDRAKMHRYVEMYLRTAPKVIAELQSHLDSNNLESLKLKAHSIKPQVQYMGISALKDVLAEIESAINNKHETSELQLLVDRANEIGSKAVEELNEYLRN